MSIFRVVCVQRGVQWSKENMFRMLYSEGIYVNICRNKYSIEDDIALTICMSLLTI